MFHKVKSAAPLSGLRLLVRFEEGQAKTYDVTPLLDRSEPFRALRDVPGLFEAVQVDAGGYGVSWNDDIDLSCDELWEHGQDVHTPFDGILAFGEATAMWGLHDSTLRKAVASRRLVEGVDVQKFGKQWVVTLDAMEREYGRPKQIQ